MEKFWNFFHKKFEIFSKIKNFIFCSKLFCQFVISIKIELETYSELNCDKYEENTEINPPKKLFFRLL